jgi:hypothetical protein
MENIMQAIRAIESEIDVTELLLSTLRKSLEGLKAFPANGVPRITACAEQSDGRYRGLDVGAAVRQSMQSRKSATLDEIRDALDRGGITWGKYPKRQVKLAVVNSPKMYAIKGDLVTLIPSS